VLAQGRALLTMNITDFQVAPLSQVYRTVVALAQRQKTVPVEAEIIGLIPEAACEQDSEWMRQLTGFDPSTKILERRLTSPLAWPTEP